MLGEAAKKISGDRYEARHNEGVVCALGRTRYGWTTERFGFPRTGGPHMEFGGSRAERKPKELHAGGRRVGQAWKGAMRPGTDRG